MAFPKRQRQSEAYFDFVFSPFESFLPHSFSHLSNLRSWSPVILSGYVFTCLDFPCRLRFSWSPQRLVFSAALPCCVRAEGSPIPEVFFFRFRCPWDPEGLPHSLSRSSLSVLLECSFWRCWSLSRSRYLALFSFKEASGKPFEQTSHENWKE